LEYKQSQYGNSENDRKELLKDISAFANLHGGHIIIGISEHEGVANELVGISIDADAELLRIEEIHRSGIEPVITGIRMKAIALTNGNKAIIIRIPRSWNSPHRILFKKNNRFHIRHSAGVHEPSMGELRIMFNQSSDAFEKARAFRNQRVEKVCSGGGLRPLQGNGRLFMHLIPVASMSGMMNLNVETICSMHDHFGQLGSSGRQPRYNFEGVINEISSEVNEGYTQIFRNGVVEDRKSVV
jgi:hypothetical protein